jgi:hypothetical protein
MTRVIRSERPASGLDQTKDVGESLVPVLGEEEVARTLRRGGQRVAVHRDRWWVQTRLGFWQPVHDMARLSAWEATRPSLACWGFQACLSPNDAVHANAAYPVHLMSDLGNVDEKALASSVRNKLRKARRLVRLVQLTGPALLREQGYDVYLSARSRTGYGRARTRTKYLEAVDRFVDPGRAVALAGLVDGRLGGYLVGHAVGQTAYIDTTVIATQTLPTGISPALTYEFIHACRRTGTIRELVSGLHARENDSLCGYKERLGFTVQRLPSRVAMLPGAGAYIRRRKPHTYYRLTGRG